MKKTKKLAALFLALMMAFSLMAVTAAAHDAAYDCSVCSENEITPRAVYMKCPECGGSAELHKALIHNTWVEWFECACGWVSW